MKKPRPFVLSIAGFDPCGGAGVLADIKTFESLKVSGLGVSTCITFQNEAEFNGLEWLDIQNIKNQVDSILSKYQPEFVKIGLVEDLDILQNIIDHLKSVNKDIKIIWDPVFKSTTGFFFHKEVKFEDIKKVLENIYLITPNFPEIQQINKNIMPLESGKLLSEICNVFLKGGHNQEKPAYDHLFVKGKSFSFRPKEFSDYSKHGTGCVLSSAICAYLAKGFKLHKACLHAKDYTTRFIQSNKTLLGYHK